VMAASRNKGTLYIGFHGIFPADTLPAGKIIIAAWAVDMNQNAISPLPGSHLLQAGNSR
jgi:hypothetical protein